MIKPPSSTSKKRFFGLLERAVHKGEKVKSQTKTKKKSGYCIGKKTRSRKTASASG